MDLKKVSIVDIAQMANVSIATVSRVLNQTGRYSTQTEQKILDLVKTYGYTPNATAKSLRTNKTQSIGVIVPDITNEFFAKIVRAIENYILPSGYSVFICDSHENEALETAHIENLIAKNVDGVIYISGKADALGPAQSRHIPVVYIDRHPENAPAIVQSDNIQGGFLAAEELLRKGCKRIVILQDYHRLSTLKQRFAGYESAHQQYGVPLDRTLVPPDCPGYQEAKQTVLTLCKQGVSFDGIFATNDTLALGALHALGECKRKVPGDVKLVGFDDTTLSAYCETPITTITQNSDEMGRRCVELLMRQMHGEQIGHENIIVPVTLHVRSTT